MKKYDSKNVQSIKAYADALVGQTFLDILNISDLTDEERNNIIAKFNNPNYKGSLGNLLEKHYFGMEINNLQQPDFSEVGLELKVSPFEIKKNNELRAGERLSITMIPHDKPIAEAYYDSDLYHKLDLILLISYLRDKNIDLKLNYEIKYSYIYSPPKEDLDIIINDYNTIVSKIINGKAHELSEADTQYLGACTKGANAEKSVYPQYYGDKIPAKSRNFCLKQSYMTYVLNNYVAKNKILYEKIIKNENDLKQTTFEKYVEGLINKHIGKTDFQLCNEYGREYNNNKLQWVDLTYRMLGIKSNKAEEFTKANIIVKTIRIEENNKIKENMSFPPFKFMDIIKETWEDSSLYNYFNETKLMFVVFKKKENRYYLKGCQFWNMPYNDLNTTVKDAWYDTVNKIRTGIKLEVIEESNGKKVVTNNFIKKSDDRIIHVRPHACKSYTRFDDGTIIGSGSIKDANMLPNGVLLTTQSFWLNNDYILKQLKKDIK